MRPKMVSPIFVVVAVSHWLSAITSIVPFLVTGAADSSASSAVPETGDSLAVSSPGEGASGCASFSLSGEEAPAVVSGGVTAIWDSVGFAVFSSAEDASSEAPLFASLCGSDVSANVSAGSGSAEPSVSDVLFPLSEAAISSFIRASFAVRTSSCSS